MRAYKFRSSTQIAYALDIVFNNRLRCSDWNKLNDPMEGMFECSYASSAQAEPDLLEQVNKIIAEKKRLRVCSLSMTFDCHLLWAHYASGFDGLAIEVELPDHLDKVKKVRYGPVRASIFIKDSILVDADELANYVLTSKYKEWKYEKEVRVLNDSDWYRLDAPVKRIIVGHRMNPVLVETLRIVCAQMSIALCRTNISDNGLIEAVPIPSLDE